MSHSRGDIGTLFANGSTISLRHCRAPSGVGLGGMSDGYLPGSLMIKAEAWSYAILISARGYPLASIAQRSKMTK
jgi:hypothetical protein